MHFSGIKQLRTERLALALQIKPLNEEHMVIYNQLCATENKHIAIGFHYWGSGVSHDIEQLPGEGFREEMKLDLHPHPLWLLYTDICSSLGG